MKQFIKLIALVALMGSGFITQAQTIKIPAIKSSTEEPKITNVEYVDGIKIKVYGSNTVTTRKPLYLAAYAIAHPSTKPPVVVPPPIVSPPVIKWDIYTPENLAKMVSLKDTYVKIKPGTYTGQYELKNFTNVTIDLQRDLGTTFSTKNSLAFVLKGETNGLHFINGSVKNTNSPFVSYDYLGATFLSDITFDNMVLENTASLFDSQGGYKDSKEEIALGVINNFKVTNSVFKNSPGQGTFVVVKGDNFLFDNNTFDNVAVSTGQHAHILMLMGRGTISNNKLTNHRGSLERLTAYNIYSDTTKKTLIFNNIVDNSTRYGAFEVFWTYEDTMAGGNWHPSSVLIYNNTVGRLGFEDKIWENTLVDIYDSRGPVVAYKNLCYQMFSTNNASKPKLLNYASRNGNDPTVKEFDNKYFNTWQEAVTDLKTFKSKYEGFGASIK